MADSLRVPFVAVLAVVVLATTGRAQQPATTQAAGRPAMMQLWQQLGEEDGLIARKAIWELQQVNGAAEFLSEMLGGPPADEATLARCLANLDADLPEARERAEGELSRMDLAAEPALSAALRAQPSPEAKGRIEHLLAECRANMWSSAISRRKVRGVWALESIESPAARQQLEKLAKGEERHRVTLLAREALAHLTGAKAAATAMTPALKYEITLLTPEVKLDGSVQFTASLRNDSQVPVVVYWGDYAYENMYLPGLKRTDGAAISAPDERAASPHLVAEEKYFHEIPPGQTVKYEMWLSPGGGANVQSFYFRRAGQYTMEPTFNEMVGRTLDGAGEIRMVPGAWRGSVAAAPVKFAVVGDAKAMNEGVTISGQVVDRRGQPIAGAAVLASKRVVQTGMRGGWNGPDGMMTSPVERVTSDAQGKFSVSRMPGDAPWFVLTASHREHPDAEVTIPADPPKKELTTKLEMADGLMIRGTVVDSEGRPVAGVRVGNRQTSFTDEKGRFVVPGVLSDPDQVHASLWMPGFAAVTLQTDLKTATSGEWKLVFLREEQQGFSGQAVFPDGRPAAGLRLEFSVKDAAGTEVHPYVNEKTDADGKFKAVLSRRASGALSGTVWAVGAEKQGYNMPHDNWAVAIKDIKPGQKDVKLVFEDRLSITANVKPANDLPESMSFRVLCYLAKGPQDRQHTVSARRVYSTGGEVEFERLGPGNYVIEVTAEQAEHWRWEQKVELKADQLNKPAKVEFALPAMHFGGASATVVDSNGRPISGRVWMDSSASWGGGNFVEGRVRLADVPVGKVYLEISSKGMTTKKVEGVVEEGKVTDLGRVVLENEKQTQAVVEGKLLYDDGTPVLGASWGGIFAKEAVGVDGLFHLALPMGVPSATVYLAFDLRSASGWPLAKALGPGRDYGGDERESIRDVVVAPVKVEAGKSVKRDVTVPRGKLATMPVRIDGAGKQADAFVVAAVEVGEASVVRRWHAHAPVEGPVSTAAVEFPAGPTVVQVYVPRTGYRGWAKVAAGKFAEGASFDASVSGTVTLRAEGTGAKLPAELKVRASAPELPWLNDPTFLYGGIGGPMVVQALPPAEGVAATDRRNADGSITILNLSPGRWVITPAEGDTFAAVTVEVEAGKDVVAKVKLKAPIATQP